MLFFVVGDGRIYIYKTGNYEGILVNRGEFRTAKQVMLSGTCCGTEGAFVCSWMRFSSLGDFLGRSCGGELFPDKTRVANDMGFWFGPRFLRGIWSTVSRFELVKVRMDPSAELGSTRVVVTVS